MEQIITISILIILNECIYMHKEYTSTVSNIQYTCEKKIVQNSIQIEHQYQIIYYSIKKLSCNVSFYISDGTGDPTKEWVQ